MKGRSGARNSGGERVIKSYEMRQKERLMAKKKSGKRLSESRRKRDGSKYEKGTTNITDRYARAQSEGGFKSRTRNSTMSDNFTNGTKNRHLAGRQPQEPRRPKKKSGMITFAIPKMGVRRPHSAMRNRLLNRHVSGQPRETDAYHASNG